MALVLASPAGSRQARPSIAARATARPATASGPSPVAARPEACRWLDAGRPAGVRAVKGRQGAGQRSKLQRQEEHQQHPAAGRGDQGEGGMTPAMKQALKWLNDRGGDGCFTKHGVALAQGELAPVTRS